MLVRVKLAESYALQFSRRAAAQLDEQPLTNTISNNIQYPKGYFCVIQLCK